MKIEHVHNDFRYTLSNDDLKEGDKVYPIAHGRCLGGDDWILHELDFKETISGFPYSPHTVIDLKYSDYKPEEVRTDHGCSPRERYYKIIKVEKQISKGKGLGKTWEWTEIGLEEVLEKEQ